VVLAEFVEPAGELIPAVGQSADLSWHIQLTAQHAQVLLIADIALHQAAAGQPRQLVEVGADEQFEQRHAAQRLAGGIGEWRGQGAADAQQP
jgi:hypothetical protein